MVQGQEVVAGVEAAEGEEVELDGEAGRLGGHGGHGAVGVQLERRGAADTPRERQRQTNRQTRERRRVQSTQGQGSNFWESSLVVVSNFSTQYPRQTQRQRPRPRGCAVCGGVVLSLVESFPSLLLRPSCPDLPIFP